MSNTKNMVELTPDTYYDFANDCVVEIKNTKEKINGLKIEFNDKERFIKTSREEIKHLMESIRITEKEEKNIKYQMSKHERSLSVNVKFLNKLNKAMNKKRGGVHLVDYQKRKVLKG